MECERILASALFLREDGYTAGQAQYINILHQQPSAGCELVDGGGSYKVGFGGGDDFSVDDLLDLGDGGGAEDASAACQGGYWKAASDSNSGAADAPEPPVPVGDITDLEWVSQFVDDSYAYVPPCPVPSYAAVVTKAASKHDHRPLQFVPNPTSRSPSAGSVSCPVSGVCLKRPWSSSVPEEDSALAPWRKARSKRARTAWGARAWAGTLLQEPLASSSSSCSSTSSSSSSFLEQPYVPAAPRARGRPPLHKKGFGGDQVLQREKPKKKKGRKPKVPSSGGSSAAGLGEVTGEESGAGTGRRCSHCGVQKTPQWRAGPMGAKTLCNACGVRYKSGRLLPEYRPACSPTFVSHVHSNSHRKVLEMRRNKELMQEPQSARAAETAQAMPAQQMVC